MNPSDTEIVTKLVESLSISVHRTRGGSLAVVFTEEGGGDRPLLGAYHTEHGWVTTQWQKDGTFMDVPRKIDLVVVSHNPESA